jgi:ABC-type Mn2+/Zn2+ transport system permease subunit
MSELFTMYEAPFMRDALVAGAINGALLGYLGLWLILRRQIFLGAALPQFAAAGIVIGAALGVPTLAAALAGVFLGTAATSTAGRRARLEKETLTGIGFALSAAAVFLVAAAFIPDLHCLGILSGDILGVNPEEIRLLAAVAIVILVVHIAAWKEFVLVSYDREAATTLGYRIVVWEAVLLATIGAGVAASLKTSGAVLSFAALVGPASAALLLARRMGSAVALASIFGAASAGIGLTLSFMYELPSGPAMAAAMLLPLPFAAAIRQIRRR